MSCSYMLAIIWRIYVTIFIDYENNEDLDVFNGFDTFYNSYDFYDENGVHEEGPW